MTSKKPLEVKNVHRFLEILEKANGIYVPEVIGDRERYKPGDLGQAERKLMRQGPFVGLLLKRKTPIELNIVLTLVQEEFVTRVPHNIFVSIDGHYFDSSERLRELVNLGNSLYEYFSPSYGFITLPWMPALAVAQPSRGLTGWGWATWLGPEYEPIIRLPVLTDVAVNSTLDGGRLFLLPYPKDATTPDPRCLRAYEEIRRHVDPRVFQVSHETGPNLFPGSPLPRGMEQHTVDTSKADGLPGDILRQDFGHEAKKATSRASVMSEQEERLSKVASAALMDLIFFTLDHGTESVRSGGPLVPFLVVEEEGKRSIRRYAANRLEQGVAQAKEEASKLAPAAERYAIAYDGYLTTESVKHDAIFVEAAERGESRGVRFAQRYVPRRISKEFNIVGNVAYLGECEQLIRN